MPNVYEIAEPGVIHNGELGLARRLVDCAAEAGADAVKFQTFDAKKLATRAAPKARYQRHTTDAAESQLEMMRRGRTTTARATRMTRTTTMTRAKTSTRFEVPGP